MSSSGDATSTTRPSAGRAKDDLRGHSDLEDQRGLADALDLPDRSDGRVGRVLVALHVWRSDPDHAPISAIPPGLAAEIQIADGREEVVGSHPADLLEHRRALGEGGLCLARTMGALRVSEPILPIGLETVATEMNGSDAAGALRRNETGQEAVWEASGARGAEREEPEGGCASTRS